MAERTAIWRHTRVLARSFWLQRRAAAFVVTMTAPSGTTVFVWLLVVGAVIGLWYGVHIVAPAHNSTLVWTTGICLCLLFLLVFVPAASSGGSRLLRSKAKVTALVDSLYFAYRVGDKGQVVKRSDIRSVRRMFGVVVVAGKDRSNWIIVPADLFPTREQWRKLTGRSKSPVASAAEQSSSDVPKWGG